MAAAAPPSGVAPGDSRVACDVLASDNARSSRLLALPPELRLRILALLLSDVHVHVSASRRGEGDDEAGGESRGHGGRDGDGAAAPAVTTRIDVFPLDHPPPRYFVALAATKWPDVLNGRERAHRQVPCPSCDTELGGVGGAGAAHAGSDSSRGGPLHERPEGHPSAWRLRGLWRVCRQFHNEVLALLFSERNVFSFSPGLAALAAPRRSSVNLPPSFAEGVSRVWVEHLQDIRAHVDDLGIHGLRAPLEIHAARNYGAPRAGAPSIYGTSPLWLTDPYEIESELMAQKMRQWAGTGTRLVFHDRPG